MMLGDQRGVDHCFKQLNQKNVATRWYNWDMAIVANCDYYGMTEFQVLSNYDNLLKAILT